MPRKPRKSKKRGIPRPQVPQVPQNLHRLKKRLLLAVNAVILVAGLAWYAFQPAQRRTEINRMARVYFGHNKNVSIADFVWDVWQLYHAKTVQWNGKPDENPLFAGPPTRTDGTTLRLLVNTAYCVGYDEARRLPAWASYRLFDITNTNNGIPERPDQFLPDKRTLSPVTSEEYTGSGFDRGHLAPNYAIARCFGADAQKETFLLSNIVPQRHSLNAGIWKSLEQRVAVNYTGRFAEVWVIDGPVFGNTVRRIPSGLEIPQAMFKIILDVQDNGLRVIAFIIPQDAPDDADLAKFLCSVDVIEQKTGLDFFPELDTTAQNALEAHTATRAW